MPKPRLPWFKLWATSSRHNKIAALSDRTFRVWVELLDAASEQPVRGRFPSYAAAAAVVRRKASEVRQVASAGLMDEMTDGVWMHDWRDWQRWRPEDTAVNDSGITPESLTNGNGLTHESRAIEPPTAPESPTESAAIDTPPRVERAKKRDERREIKDVAAVAATPEPDLPIHPRAQLSAADLAKHEQMLAQDRARRLPRRLGDILKTTMGDGA